MPSSTDVVQVRPGRPTDLAFVYRTWLDVLRQADVSPLPNDIFFPAHREYINRVLADPKVELQVACPTDRPNDILGYVVAHSGELIQWLYLKPQFRGKHLGLVQLLLQSVQCETCPLLWKTPDSRKMRNPLRSRQNRHRVERSSSTALPSPASK